MAEWFTTFPSEFWLPGDDSAPAEAAFIRRVLRLRRGQRVLDCPCGDGRVMVELAAAGCRVLGVDRDGSFIDAARRRLRRRGLRAELLTMDMRQIDFGPVFDAVLNWHGSFGYFDERGNRRLLAAMAGCLRPGGRLLIDQPNREAMLRHFEPIRHGDIEIRSRWNRRTQRVGARWSATRGGRRVVGEMSMRLYTPRQIRRLVESAGLRVEAVYGDRQGRPYGRGSRRMIIIARRPG